jgi:nucleoside-diphosphate-sugar epimerase
MNSTRNLVDIDDLFLTVDYILKNKLFINRIINVANPHNYTIPEIIHAFEKILKLRAVYDPLPKGTPFEMDVTEILPVYRELNISFAEPYLENLIKKYYL